VVLHLTAKGKTEVPTTYTENFYIRYKWPSKLTDIFLQYNEELHTDENLTEKLYARMSVLKI